MPTIEPRIYVTPSARTGPLLREYAAVTGKAPSALVRELLDECAPALAAMLEAHKVINERPAAAREAVRRLAADSRATIAQAELDLASAMKRRPGPKPRKGAAKTG